MEVSSHALTQERIAGLEFHTAVFTNLTRDHLDEHGDLASYGDAKRRLFTLPGLEVRRAERATTRSRRRSPRLSRRVARSCARASRDSTVELSARLKRADLSGLDLDIAGKFGAGRLTSRLIGEFNAENLLVARSARCSRKAWRCRRRARRSAPRSPAPGRMEVLGGPPRPAVGRRRLCAHAGRVAARADDARSRGRRRALVRVRLRRRSRSRQAPADGRRRGGSRGPHRADRRQPAQRGSGGDRGRDSRRVSAITRASTSFTTAAPR